MLICPTWEDVHRRKMKARAFRFPPVNLTLLAAMTPEEWEVSIVDENVDDVDFEADVDLVGITTMTATAPRAYAIADRFRARGVKVVMGGMHASAMPQEALQHADAVVVGEAEGCWHKVLEDFKRREMRGIYRSERFPDLAGLPIPRRDLLRKKAYLTTNTIQTARGCPFGCSFCAVSYFFGRKYRMRPVKEVIAEIEAMGSKFVGFLDDNIAGDRRYAKELFQALASEGIMWAGQASTTIARDRELLKLAQKSGCKGLFVGFESISEDSLGEVGKRFNRVEEYREVIKRFHDHGIVVEGAFIFGFDHDDLGVFERTLEFAKKSGLDLAQFGILTPLPGTPLRARLEREGRIISNDWSKYNIGHAVFRPKNMTPEQLEEGTQWAWLQFYSSPSILARLFKLLGRMPSLLLPLLVINAGYHKMVYDAYGRKGWDRWDRWDRRASGSE